MNNTNITLIAHWNPFTFKMEIITGSIIEDFSAYTTFSVVLDGREKTISVQSEHFNPEMTEYVFNQFIDGDRVNFFGFSDVFKIVEFEVALKLFMKKLYTNYYDNAVKRLMISANGKVSEKIKEFLSEQKSWNKRFSDGEDFAAEFIINPESNLLIHVELDSFILSETKVSVTPVLILGDAYDGTLQQLNGETITHFDSQEGPVGHQPFQLDEFNGTFICANGFSELLEMAKTFESYELVSATENIRHFSNALEQLSQKS